MRDQDTDLACMAEEGEELRPMRLRYGVTVAEATHHEPLDVSLNQEVPEQFVDDDGTWDDMEPELAAVVRNHPSGAPEYLDEEQVAPAAEQSAMNILGVIGR